jgi:iron complex transport system ATP-binding protein
MLGRTPYIAYSPSKEDKQIVEQVIEEIGLEELASRNVSSLSGGEKQKVMIALALASDSKILLLDEPTANLDIKNSLMVMNLIKLLTEKKKLTVLISMHDVSLAYNYGDYFLLMGGNKVKYSLERKEINNEVLQDIYGINLQITKDGLISYKEETKNETK